MQRLYMSNGNLTFSGFTVYELFRFLIPGIFGSSFVFLGLYLYIEDLISLISSEFTIVFTVLTLFIGFIIYGYDHPKRTKHFKDAKEKYSAINYLQKLCEENPNCNEPEKEDLKKLFFYILNRLLDPGIRERAYYFTSLYHLYTNIILLMIISLIVYLVMLILNLSLHLFDDKIYLQTTFLLLIFAFTLILELKGKHKEYLEDSFKLTETWIRINEREVKDTIDAYCKTKKE